MVKNFTQNDLVSYLYKEVNPLEYLALTESIENDWDVFQDYKVLRNAKKNLPLVTFSPKPSTIENILRFSKNYKA
ncbi:MAG: hypothetical protein EA362_12555 [Saprospirales bacterium]|nr:MAG: hypothetical protein EA362_12555 [Saprospirales bacterium]